MQFDQRLRSGSASAQLFRDDTRLDQCIQSNVVDPEGLGQNRAASYTAPFTDIAHWRNLTLAELHSLLLSPTIKCLAPLILARSGVGAPTPIGYTTGP